MSLEMSPSHLVSASGPTLASRKPPENSEFLGSRINRLRLYQREVALAVLDSVFGRKDLTFAVEDCPAGR
jgi:hypothetical protein